MKTVRDVLRKSPIWVNPDHTAETAAIILRGHNIGALPVLDNGRLVGQISYQQILCSDPGALVRDLMITDVPAISPELTVKQAAELMRRHKMGRLPVALEGRLIGVVTEGDLLPEVGRSFDPLTSLPWSDSLREWAIEELKRGRELTVLFLDLNGFGHFNKKYGHLVGDEVLRSVAKVLEPLVDPYTDYLCKFGGDEFCIGTLRSADDATELGRRAALRISEIEVEGAGGEPITCSIGQFGGKRTREREHIHYAATLNNLINLASRDCIAGKAVGEHALEGTIETGDDGPRVRLSWIEVKWTGPRAQVKVELERQKYPGTDSCESESEAAARLFPSTMSAKTDEAGVLQLVAEATSSSLQRILPEGYSFILGEVITNETSDGQTLITAVGAFASGGKNIQVAGSAIVGGDPYRASAAAVLAAVNRLLGKFARSDAQHNGTAAE